MLLSDARETVLRADRTPGPVGLCAAELPLTAPCWHEFVGGSSSATPFHHPAWASTVAECYGYRPFALVVRDEGGRIVAGLPLAEVRSALTGRRTIALPFTDHCPPLAEDSASLASLTAALDALRRREGLPRVEVHGPLPEQSGVHLQCSAVLHTLPLVPDATAVFKGFKKTQVQQPIAKAQREGVTIRQSRERDALEAFYRLHLHTRRRQGVPVQPRRFFDLLHARVLAPGLGYVLLAYHGATPIAAAVFLDWNGVTVYKYGASDPRYLGMRPNHLLVWTAIRRSCEDGAHLFDFGKTDLENHGLRAFKRGWGARETPLLTSAIADDPPARGEGRARQLLGIFIRRTPPVTCQVTGALLYRHFA